MSTDIDAGSLAEGIILSYWRPIETAPKDGTHILAFRKRTDGGGQISEAWWQREWIGEGYQLGGRGWCYADYSFPTHWMPKPEDPTQ